MDQGTRAKGYAGAIHLFWLAGALTAEVAAQYMGYEADVSGEASGVEVLTFPALRLTL